MACAAAAYLLQQLLLVLAELQCDVGLDFFPQLLLALLGALHTRRGAMHVRSRTAYLGARGHGGLADACFVFALHGQLLLPAQLLELLLPLNALLCITLRNACCGRGITHAPAARA